MNGLPVRRTLDPPVFDLTGTATHNFSMIDAVRTKAPSAAARRGLRSQHARAASSAASAACLIAACAGTATVVHAQAWPSRPIRLIVPFAPGGSTDVLARVLGPKLGYDIARDLAPIVLLAKGPFVLMSTPASSITPIRMSRRAGASASA